MNGPLFLFYETSMRERLLLLGFLFVLINKLLPFDFSQESQVYLFFAGVLLLGVPHGAADMLVAEVGAEKTSRVFSPLRFLIIYLVRLVLFAVFIWFFPLAGNLVFVLFAAYHFGETDLHDFKTDTVAGKLFVISYGLLILGFILLHQFETLIPLFSMFPSGQEATGLIQWIAAKKYLLLGLILLLFFISTFFYFSRHETGAYNSGSFLIRLGAILCILYFLPMMLAFTFYFIIWHSVLSLRNILTYVSAQKKHSKASILKQILFYSLLALIGIALAGTGGFVFIHPDTILVYVFLGLAVLTAPHMQVMHEMYTQIRKKSL